MKSLKIAPQEALFVCKTCEEEWKDELPPLWLGFETWPTCCGSFAYLIHMVYQLV